jgi:hypothetical protein
LIPEEPAVTDPSSTTTNIATAGISTCPAWCVGEADPEHDQFDEGFPADVELTRFHNTRPVRVAIESLNNSHRSIVSVCIQQMEARSPGDGSISFFKPAVEIGGGIEGSDMTVAEARQLGKALVDAAGQLEQILAGGAR